MLPPAPPPAPLAHARTSPSRRRQIGSQPHQRTTKQKHAATIAMAACGHVLGGYPFVR